MKKIVSSTSTPAQDLWRIVSVLVLLLTAFFFYSPAYAAMPASSHAPLPHAGQQILFVEDNVADYRQLVPPDSANMELVVLDASKDGLRQIADTLRDRRDIAAVHLISHGGPATLKLGSLSLDSVQLARRSADLDIIRAALQGHADILLYGCNVAAGDAGQRFIRHLADATGAAVAASTNLTGAAEQAGDWLLESRTGSLRSAALAFPAYRQVLPTVAGTVAIPFGQPDNNFSTAKFTDGQALTGSTDIPGIVYEVYFADTGNTQTGRVSNIDLAGGTGSMLWYFNNATGQYDPVGALIIKSQANRLFGLSSFRIQDAQFLNATYTATAYRNNVVVGTLPSFTTGGSTNPVTISLGGQFKNVDEIRITSNGGAGGVGAKLWQEGFNSFVFIDPTTNADLAALSASAGALVPGFTAANGSYSFSVSAATSSTTITPTVDIPSSTVTVNGVTVASGAASGAIALNVGANTITTVVTAGDGTSTRTYTITATRAAPPSGNANLSALALSSGTLNPAFASGTLAYTAGVSFTTTSLTVTPTVADSTATVTVNGVATASGNASGAIALAVGSNTITTIVTAQDGSTTKTYTTTVTRAAASSNNQLSALSLSSGTLAPVFAAGTTGYSASVGNATTALTVTPTVADATASVTVNGVATTSGNASGAIALAVGANTITVTVTAQNGTPLSYTVSVTRAGSANADLSALSLSSGTLAPAFASGTTGYTASVSNATTSLTVTPTLASATASVTVNGVATNSGNASGAIPLAVGSNTITVTATAQDGTTVKTYIATVTRAASSNNNLSGLSSSAGSLSPAFNPATTSYVMAISAATASIAITPTVAAGTASVTVNGVAVSSGAASGAIGMNPGSNTVTVIVTAQNSATRQYTLTVTRDLPSANASLSALSLSSGTLAPVFASGTTSYTTSVSNATTSLTATPTVADATASVTVNGVATTSGNASGAIALAVGANTITVTVTAQNGTPLSYTVSVTRAGSANADLSALILSSGTLAPAFAAGTTGYTASVGNATTSLTVTPTLAAGTASVTVNGVAATSGNASGAIPLAVGSNTITVTVTAQDGTVKTYTATVTRAASANNTLSALSSAGGSLSPAFNPATTSYTMAISTATVSIAITPTVADGTASVTVNGVAVSSGAASGAIAMNLGSNTVTVIITAQNSATRQYTLTVTRALPSANASLGALALSSGTLAPVFASGTTGYTASVSNATTSLTVTPTVADSSATIKANGVTIASGNASGAIPLTIGSNTVTVAVTAQNGTTVTTYTVIVTRAASPSSSSLAGFVYTDANHDGIKDNAETGLAAVTVKLSGTDLDGGAIDLTTVTGADGSFAFNTLKGGNYTLTETQPASSIDGKETAGTLGGTVDNSGFDDSPARNRIANIVLGAGQNASGYLFGEQSTGSLQGFVYVDANGNGSKDAGEAGLAGVRLTLSGSTAGGVDVCTQRASCSATSSADGSYAFAGITAGTYALSKNPADIDGSLYADGRERAGAAGGVVNAASFGSQPLQNSITAIKVDAATVAGASGKLDGYLFGLRSRGVAGIKLPIVSGAVLFSSKATPGHGSGGIVAGWSITLSQNGTALCTVTSNVQGQYQLDNLACPSYAGGLPTGSGFALQFRKAGTNLTGVPDSGGEAGTKAFQSIRNITLSATDEITQQNLPLDPEGVVYDAVSRLPLAGATIAISGPPGFDPATHLVGGAAVQSQVTGADGIYQYLLQNGFPTGIYTLAVLKAPDGYGTASALLPPCVGTLNVGASPDPAFIQASDTAPAAGNARHDPKACTGLVDGGASSTQYYLSLFITNGVSAPVLNNHIALDAAVAGGLSLSKSGDRNVAELGDTVRYTIVLNQRAGSSVIQASVRDVLPAGFRFIPGTVTVNGTAAADPVTAPGAVLGFNLGAAGAANRIVLSYRARLGVGSMQGDGVNRARAYACNVASGCLDAATLAPLAGSMASNEASFKVQVSGGVFTNDACVAGKVFTDCNGNGMQDTGEAGIPAVRLYLEDGTHFTTDVDGKYSYCGLSPRSHVIKVDSITLPAGSTLGATSNRNLGDPDSLLLDVKNGELIRADFAETSCSAPVLERIHLLRSPPALQAPPARSSPGVTFSSKVNRQVNVIKQPAAPIKLPAKGEQHAQ